MKENSNTKSAICSCKKVNYNLCKQTKYLNNIPRKIIKKNILLKQILKYLNYNVNVQNLYYYEKNY